MQLVKSQREAAQLRDDRRKFLSSVREKEEALEQAMEQERRAQAEVENLRSVNQSVASVGDVSTLPVHIFVRTICDCLFIFFYVYGL